jgi:hypothetical protein
MTTLTDPNDPVDDKRSERLFVAMLKAVTEVNLGSTEEEVLIRPTETIDAATDLMAYALAASVQQGTEMKELRSIINKIADDTYMRVGVRLIQLGEIHRLEEQLSKEQLEAIDKLEEELDDTQLEALLTPKH